LKVPRSKFWCPGCAPAAEKFWHRHCTGGNSKSVCGYYRLDKGSKDSFISVNVRHMRDLQARDGSKKQSSSYLHDISCNAIVMSVIICPWL